MLAVLASGVLVAQAAKSTKTKAAKSQQMKVACAGENGVLRYVSRASKCKPPERAITLDVNNPIDACVKLHGTKDGVRGSLGQLRAARRLPAGTVRLSPPADCPAKVQPNEIGIKMPGPKKQWYCGRSTDGRLRWVSSRSKCVGRELRIWVPQGSPIQEQPTTPSGQGNKSPKGNDDSATTDKDAPLAIDVLTNDTDADGDPLSVESVNTNGTTGTVTPNPNGTITYDPAGKFNNLKPGQTAFDNFKYKVQDNHGGHSGETRVDVTIKGKNLSPKAVNDSSSTDEATAANVNVLSNDTDAEGDSLTLGPIDQTGTQGTVTAGPGNTLHYDPNNQFEDLAVGETRLDTFKYRANDGSSNSAPATVTMTVTGVNDAPTLDTTNSSAAYAEDGPAVPVDGGVALDDVDGDQIAGATVTISSNFVSADGDTLNFTNQNGITGSYNSGTGVLTLTGNASVANYQTALRSITFSNTSNTPSTSTRTVSFKAKDQHNADTNTDTRDVTVAATNDAPVNTVPAAGALDVGEDGNVTSNGFSISDADAGSGGVQTELKVLHGTLDVAAGGTLTGNGSATVKIEGTQAQISTSLASVKYTPDSNFAGSDTLTMDTSDLGHNPSPAKNDSDNYGISVSAVNDAPVLTSPGSATTDEDVTKSFSAGDVSIADVDSSTDDITATLAASHGQLTLGDLTGLTSNTGNGTGSVSLTGPRTEVNEALDGLSYAPDADYNGPDTISVGVDDLGHNGSGGAQTDSASISVTVSAVNDAPVSHVPGAQTFDEDTSRTFSVANGNSLSLSDVDLAPDSAISDLKVDHGTLTVNGTPAGLAGNGTSHVTFTETQSGTASALDGLVYTPNADFAGTDTLTYKTDDQGHNGSGGAKTDTQTVALNVSAVDDAPVVSVPGADSTPEDTPYVLSSGSSPSVADVDATSLKVTYSSTHGTMSLDPADLAALTFSNGDGTDDATMTFTGTKTAINDALNGSKFTPDTDYSGLAVITLVADDEGATGSGGPLADSDTINITVNSVNDPPTVDTTDTNASFTEAQPGAIEIDPGVTVADVDDTNIESATVKITAGHQSSDVLNLPGTLPAGVTFNHVAGSDTLTISGTATVAEYQAMLRDVTFFTPSNSPGASRTVRFTVNDGTDDSPATNATRDIDITNTNDAPVIGNVSGTVSYAEDGPAATLDSDATVTDNDTPSLTGGGRVEITNDQPGDVLEFTPQGSVNGSYSNGVLTISGSGTPAEYQAFLRSVTYKTTSDTPDTTDRTVEFQVDDGEPANHASNVATKTLQVSATNDRPTVSLPDTTPVAYTENDAATLVNAPGVVSVNDVDSLGISSATVSFSGGYLPEDVLDASPPSGLTRSFNTTTGVLTITGSGTFSEYEDALESVTYANTSNNPSTAQRTLEFVVNDGAAFNNLSTAATRRVNVTNVNDSPVLTANDAGTLTYTEDSPTENHADPIVPNLGVSDSDDANLSGATVQFTAGYASAEDNLDFTNQNGITGSYNSGTGVLTLAGSSSVANYQTALRSVAYRNTSENPDTTQRTISFQVTDGHVGDNPVSNTVSRNIDVVRTNDAPVATDETFNGTKSAVGNTTLNVDDTATRNGTTDGRPATPDPTDTSPVTDRPHKEITGDILSNDTDADNNNNQFTVTPGTFATNDGGTVTIQADGDFNFEPAPSTSCTDTSDFFDYTVNDNDSLDPKTDTGRVTIAITGCVWYVNNNDAQGNSGTSEKPFDTLAQAQTASGNNDTTFVYDGDDTTAGYNAGYTMNTGEKLLSEAAALTVGGDTLHSADAANKASLTNNNADVVTLAGGTSVRGFNIDPQGTGGGVFGTGLGATTVTLDDLDVVDNGTKGTQPGLDLDTNSGTTTNVSNLTVNNGDGSSATSGDSGVRLNNAGTVNFAPSGTISITTNGAKGLDATGPTTNMGSGSLFDDITVTNSGSGGVSMTGTTGTTTFGDLSGTDLNLTTVSGATPGFALSNAGTVTVNAGGADDVHATGGPAVDVTGTTNPTLSFDDVDSANSANDGINLDGLGTGTFSAATGDIGGESGIGIDINGGSGDITYPGTFANGSGSLVAEVTGRTGGAVSLSGSMSDTNDAGGGVNVASNTGGSTTLSGATKQFNTGASDAVTFSSSDGHTLILSGGGSDIDTTSGNGINATSSGTLQVSGSGNTIDSTGLGASNRGLNIADTDIASADVTFDHINTSGGTNGIRVNNSTNSAGDLTVIGSGGTCTAATQTGCSGGVIQSATGAGVDLATVSGAANLTRLNVKNGGDDGIRADSVGTSAGNGIALANSVITGNGNAVNENGIDYNNVLGISSIGSTVSSGNSEDNARITGTTGTGRFTVDSSTFSSNSGTLGGDGLKLAPDVSANVRALVQNSTFQANRDDGFQLNAQGDSNVDLMFNNNAAIAAGNAGPVSAHSALNFDNGGTSNVRMSMSGGSASSSEPGIGGSAVIVNPAGNSSNPASAISSTFDGSFNNVTVGTAGVPGSGSATGLGMWIKPVRNTDSAISVTNSHINGSAQFGVQYLHNDGKGNGDFTFTGNTIRTVGVGNEAIFIQSGSLTTDVIDTCADIGGAGGDNTNPPGNDFAGQASGGPTDIAFRRPTADPSSHLKLPGFSPPAGTNLLPYIQGRNVGSPSALNYSGELEAGPSSCQQPTPPTAP